MVKKKKKIIITLYKLETLVNVELKKKDKYFYRIY